MRHVCMATCSALASALGCGDGPEGPGPGFAGEEEVTGELGEG